MNLNGSLDAIVQELGRLLVQAEAEVYTRQAALDEAKQEVRRLQAVLKAAGAVEERPKAKPKAEPKRARVNDATRQRVLEAIINHHSMGTPVIPDVPGSFTVPSLETGGMHEGSVRTAVYMLRDEGLVRAVGAVPNSPRLAPMAYALADTDEQ